ncbi:uncharacterized protein LOC112606575 [Theropithecus gelada]|uniref:uncharacterized protein LOC112606575 n=1 Tax=Theropithecus gelada TaxID=9565 RepID=UPI000DC194FB|nr:uncharacterized protein LOC112606575 [Theropithecus gelada]
MPWQPRPSPPLAAGPSSPVHAVADPGITDSRAMPRVPPPAPLLGFSETHLHAASRGSSAHRPGPEDWRLPPKLGAVGIFTTSGSLDGAHETEKSRGTRYVCISKEFLESQASMINVHNSSLHAEHISSTVLPGLYPRKHYVEQQICFPSQTEENHTTII